MKILYIHGLSSSGVSGTADTTIDCSEEFKRYYTKFYTFNGGHRLNSDIIKKS